ncbi:LacI family transcriptional regulator [Bradyrhizobium sp. C-145]|uniref:LacI family DNA-binding transcriptional regulator n=1 Tax=Bradyrhizobium sp. C-145 TaxID=574727 RepID=UPI00201B757B|nr:LacI family DNA-binding transcriptional regulator [Bradyrhizobium sp. C-145]UQR66659.1 LacI family transcriptional regulator [Bradyrhizobium sp. C-145]
MDAKVKSGSPRPTLLDIAKASGVSKATVSLVLRNSPSIPERTREKVLEAAKSLGYVYNRGAASLRLPHTRMIALAVNNLTNPYFAEIVAAIEDALTAENRIVLMSNSGESVARQSAFIDTVREYNVDGLLMVPAVGTDAAFINSLHALHLPCVLVSRTVPGAKVDFVSPDHRGGMMKAMDHLIGLGHTRIGMIGSNSNISTGRDRFAGYRQALAKHGIPLEPRLVLSGAETRDVGMAQVLELLDLPEPPTAVVCFNDIVAFGAMLGLRSLNLTPGEDFSVVGFDDIAEATLWRPALTTVAIPRANVGKVATQLLLQRISNRDGPYKSTLIPTELIVRDTTCPPPAKPPRKRRSPS